MRMEFTLLPTNKEKAIIEAPRPSNVKQLQAYLGNLGYYRIFLSRISTLLEPFNKLLRKNIFWHWGEEQEKIFTTSKDLLIYSEALVHFDSALPLVVVADSSSYGVWAVLS